MLFIPVETPVIITVFICCFHLLQYKPVLPSAVCVCAPCPFSIKSVHCCSDRQPCETSHRSRLARSGGEKEVTRSLGVSAHNSGACYHRGRVGDGWADNTGREKGGWVGGGGGVCRRRDKGGLLREESQPADARSYLLFHLHELSSLFLFWLLPAEEPCRAEGAPIR